MSMPFGMKPAPKLLRTISDPIDLGRFNSEYEGWCVVIDLAVDLEVNDIISVAADDKESARVRNAAVAQWIAKSLVAWNFVDSVDGEPLPQPREGGAARCPQALIEPISMAVAEAISPKKK